MLVILFVHVRRVLTDNNTAGTIVYCTKKKKREKAKRKKKKKISAAAHTIYAEEIVGRRYAYVPTLRLKESRKDIMFAAKTYCSLMLDKHIKV